MPSGAQSEPSWGLPSVGASFDTLAKLVTAGAVLPIIGALSRSASFWIAGEVPSGVGGMASISELALLATGLLLPGLVVGSTLAYLFRTPLTTGLRLPAIRVPPAWSDRLLRPLEHRTVALGVAVTLTLAIGASVAFWLAPWITNALLASRGPSNLLTTLVTSGVIFYGLDAGRGTRVVPAARLFPIVVIMTLTTAIASSLGPNTAGTVLVDIEFNGDTGLRDGPYVLLGEDGNWTWIWDCDAPSSPVWRIPSSTIARAVVAERGPAPTVPTLQESQSSGHWVVGFVPRCPRHPDDSVGLVAPLPGD